jgi:sucrose-phosphate synthase
VRRHYSWEAHVDSYLRKIDALPGKSTPVVVKKPAGIVRYRDRAIFSDLDRNLVGEPEDLRRLADTIREHRRRAVFGIATNRRIDTALAFMKQHGLPMPDVLISSLGTRIHYGAQLIEDDLWADHIDHNWSAARLRRVLNDIPGLEPRPQKDQTPFKVSYFYDQEEAPPVEYLIRELLQHEITANVVRSFEQYLDIVPSRASKGRALRYVTKHLEIPLEHVLVAGGSGADEDMMRGNMLAVVVANRHDEELSQLVDQERIYFANQKHALGILEAIEHYDFFGACAVPEKCEGDHSKR